MAKVTNSISLSGSGGSSIIVVANYSALPDPTTVSGEFYWVSNSQGTKWLPGSLGGTYYNSGLYYSNGTTWEFMNVPYQATQLEVDTGTNTDKFVTPKTFNDSAQLANKANIASPTFTGTVTSPAIIVSSETALTISYFDASKNIKSLDTSTYPSLTELAYVKGVTSSIQSQITNIQSGIVKKILNNTVETTPLTGTTSETLIYSAPVISGGSFASDDYFNFQAVFRKQPGNSVGCTYRAYVSNTNNFATASLLATWASVRFNTVMERRNLYFKADNTINSTIPATTSTQTDLTNSDAALTSISLNPANDIYFFVSAQLGVGTDNVKMTAIKIFN